VTTGSWPRRARPTHPRRARACRTLPAHRIPGIRRSLPWRGCRLTATRSPLGRRRSGWTSAPATPRTRAGPLTASLCHSARKTPSSRTGSTRRPSDPYSSRSPSRTHPAGPSAQAHCRSPRSMTTPPRRHPRTRPRPSPVGAPQYASQPIPTIPSLHARAPKPLTLTGQPQPRARHSGWSRRVAAPPQQVGIRARRRPPTPCPWSAASRSSPACSLRRCRSGWRHRLGTASARGGRTRETGPGGRPCHPGVSTAPARTRRPEPRDRRTAPPAARATRPHPNCRLPAADRGDAGRPAGNTGPASTRAAARAPKCPPRGPASTAPSPGRCPTARVRQLGRADAAGRRQTDACERTPPAASPHPRPTYRRYRPSSLDDDRLTRANLA
jgi:hypothetical protein